MTTEFCSRCGGDFAHEGIGTGYAITPTGARLCYWCADLAQADMIRNAKARETVTLYVSCDGNRITSWSGGTMGRVIRWGKRHHWSIDRHYLSARMTDGTYWHGIGANGEYALLTKSVA